MGNNTILLSFDFGDDMTNDKLSLSLSKKSVFLIGCYRSKDKQQLDWILGNTTNRSVVRSFIFRYLVGKCLITFLPNYQNH